MNVAGSSSAAIQYPYAEHKTDSTLVNGTKEFYVLSSPAATSRGYNVQSLSKIMSSRSHYVR